MQWSRSRRSARPQVISYHGAAILWAGAIAVLMMAVMAGAFGMAHTDRSTMTVSVACIPAGGAGCS
jgi:hypothetical protein